MSLPIAPEIPIISSPADMAAGEDVVVLENITVRYRVPHERIRTFKEFIIRRMKGQVQFVDLLALHKVNLNVKEGEVFGVIGANGAGKTTMLRLVAQVMRPTEGRVVVRGRGIEVRVHVIRRSIDPGVIMPDRGIYAVVIMRD